MHFFFFYLSQIKGVPYKDNVKYVGDEAPLPSMITFWWVRKLLRLGYKRPLQETDLGVLPESETCSNNSNKFLEELEKQRKEKVKLN